MKNLCFFYKRYFAFSCSENKNVENSDPSIESIVNDLQKLANTENKTVFANKTLDKNNRFIANKIEILSDFQKGFAEGFSGKKLGESITVSCIDGTDTHCEGGGYSLIYPKLTK